MTRLVQIIVIYRYEHEVLFFKEEDIHSDFLIKLKEGNINGIYRLLFDDECYQENGQWYENGKKIPLQYPPLIRSKRIEDLKSLNITDLFWSVHYRC